MTLEMMEMEMVMEMFTGSEISEKRGKSETKRVLVLYRYAELHTLGGGGARRPGGQGGNSTEAGEGRGG
jgi:hypothetical protein